MEQKNLQTKTKAEWLKYYEERTGCKDLRLFPDEQVFFHPEHGFMTFFVYGNVLEIHHMCGDGKSWVKLVKKIMQDNGLRTVRFSTKRNPKAWQRKYGAHILGYYMETDIDEIKE